MVMRYDRRLAARTTASRAAEQRTRRQNALRAARLLGLAREARMRRGQQAPRAATPLAPGRLPSIPKPAPQRFARAPPALQRLPETQTPAFQKTHSEAIQRMPARQPARPPVALLPPGPQLLMLPPARQEKILMLPAAGTPKTQQPPTASTQPLSPAGASAKPQPKTTPEATPPATTKPARLPQRLERKARSQATTIKIAPAISKEIAKATAREIDALAKMKSPFSAQHVALRVAQKMPGTNLREARQAARKELARRKYLRTAQPVETFVTQKPARMYAPPRQAKRLAAYESFAREHPTMITASRVERKSPAYYDLIKLYAEQTPEARRELAANEEIARTAAQKKPVELAVKRARQIEPKLAPDEIKRRFEARREGTEPLTGILLEKAKQLAGDEYRGKYSRRAITNATSKPEGGFVADIKQGETTTSNVRFYKGTPKPEEIRAGFSQFKESHLLPPTARTQLIGAARITPESLPLYEKFYKQNPEAAFVLTRIFGVGPSKKLFEERAQRVFLDISKTDARAAASWAIELCATDKEAREKSPDANWPPVYNLKKASAMEKKLFNPRLLSLYKKVAARNWRESETILEELLEHSERRFSNPRFKKFLLENAEGTFPIGVATAYLKTGKEKIFSRKFMKACKEVSEASDEEHAYGLASAFAKAKTNRLVSKEFLQAYKSLPAESSNFFLNAFCRAYEDTGDKRVLGREFVKRINKMAATDPNLQLSAMWLLDTFAVMKDPWLLSGEFENVYSRACKKNRDSVGKLLQAIREKKLGFLLNPEAIRTATSQNSYELEKLLELAVKNKNPGVLTRKFLQTIERVQRQAYTASEFLRDAYARSRAEMLLDKRFIKTFGRLVKEGIAVSPAHIPDEARHFMNATISVSKDARLNERFFQLYEKISKIRPVLRQGAQSDLGLETATELAETISALSQSPRRKKKLAAQNRLLDAAEKLVAKKRLSPGALAANLLALKNLSADITSTGYAGLLDPGFLKKYVNAKEHKRMPLRLIEVLRLNPKIRRFVSKDFVQMCEAFEEFSPGSSKAITDAVLANAKRIRAEFARIGKLPGVFNPEFLAKFKKFALVSPKEINTGPMRVFIDAWAEAYEETGSEQLTSPELFADLEELHKTEPNAANNWLKAIKETGGTENVVQKEFRDFCKKIAAKKPGAATALLDAIAKTKATSLATPQLMKTYERLIDALNNSEKTFNKAYLFSGELSAGSEGIVSGKTAMGEINQDRIPKMDEREKGRTQALSAFAEAFGATGEPRLLEEEFLKACGKLLENVPRGDFVLGKLITAFARKKDATLLEKKFLDRYERIARISPDTAVSVVAPLEMRSSRTSGEQVVKQPYKDERFLDVLEKTAETFGSVAAGLADAYAETGSQKLMEAPFLTAVERLAKKVPGIQIVNEFSVTYAKTGMKSMLGEFAETFARLARADVNLATALGTAIQAQGCEALTSEEFARAFETLAQKAVQDQQSFAEAYGRFMRAAETAKGEEERKTAAEKASRLLHPSFLEYFRKLSGDTEYASFKRNYAAGRFVRAFSEIGAEEMLEENTRRAYLDLVTREPDAAKTLTEKAIEAKSALFFQPRILREITGGAQAEGFAKLFAGLESQEADVSNFGQKMTQLQADIERMKQAGNAVAVAKLEERKKKLSGQKKVFLLNEIINAWENKGGIPNVLFCSALAESPADHAQMRAGNISHFQNLLAGKLKAAGIDSEQVLGKFSPTGFATNNGWTAPLLQRLLIPENMTESAKHPETLSGSVKHEAFEETFRTTGAKNQTLEKEEILKISQSLVEIRKRLISDEVIAPERFKELVEKLAKDTHVESLAALFQKLLATENNGERARLMQEIDKYTILKSDAFKKEYEAVASFVQAPFRKPFAERVKETDNLVELRAVAQSLETLLNDPDAHGFIAGHEKLSDLKDHFKGLHRKIPWEGKEDKILAKTQAKDLLTMLVNDWDCVAPKGFGPFSGMNFHRGFMFLERPDTQIIDFSLGKTPIGRAYLVKATVGGAPAVIIDAFSMSKDYFSHHSDTTCFLKAVQAFAQKVGASTVLVSKYVSNASEMFAKNLSQPKSRKVVLEKAWPEDGYSECMVPGKSKFSIPLREITVKEAQA